ncbi:Heteropolysaccharide repeat unit export protein [Enhygromyxa salina]|uniref:Heteropolysaccharide repeat unit export protein n=1 Tax=Enhygromyxa salina TaxID=215803 RepID=A0A0C2D403_9BACT|nr:hypothetical protein [Enhygromyxa salina]KIG14827.1 Heteropolysaccharide repeat unit export protein [Enhygromyxa salina]
MSETPDSVGRSLSWTLLGELSFAAAQWLALIVVAKLGSPEALGRYSLGLAVATPIIILANLHLRPIYVVDTRARWGFADYLGLRAIMLPLALGVTAGVCLIRGWPWQVAAVVCLLGVIRVAGSVSDILYGRAQRAQKMDTIGISRAVQGGLWIGLLALGLVLGDEVLALGMVAAGLTLHMLFYDRRRAAQVQVADDPLASGRSLRPRFDRVRLRGLAWEALPMGVAAGLLGLTGNVPTYVLEDTHGLEAAGFFAAVLSVIQASGVVNVALGNAAIPKLARLSVDDARGFWVLLVKLLGLVVVLNGVGVVIVALIGDAYLRYAYTPEYAVYLPELVVASITAVVLGLANMLSQTLTALSRFRLQLWLNLAALGCSVGVGLWLIPTRGIAGAIQTLLVLAGFRLVLYLTANIAVGPRAARGAGSD